MIRFTPAAPPSLPLSAAERPCPVAKVSSGKHPVPGAPIFSVLHRQLPVIALRRGAASKDVSAMIRLARSIALAVQAGHASWRHRPLRPTRLLRPFAESTCSAANTAWRTRGHYKMMYR